MAERHEETVGKKIGRMLGKFILVDHRDDPLTMADIVDGCAEQLVTIVSMYPGWVAAKVIPPIARPIMKDRVRGLRLNGDLPLLPGFEGLRLGIRFAVPPPKVVDDDDNVEPLDEESHRTIWIPRHKINMGQYRRHVQSYIALRDDIQKETDLRQEVLMRAEDVGGDDDELLIDVLGRAME